MGKRVETPVNLRLLGVALRAEILRSGLRQRGARPCAKDRANGWAPAGKVSDGIILSRLR